jgi:hypothetical protein
VIAAGENARPVTEHHQPVRMVHNRVPVKRMGRFDTIVAVDNGLDLAAFAAFVAQLDCVAARQTHGTASKDRQGANQLTGASAIDRYAVPDFDATPLIEGANSGPKVNFREKEKYLKTFRV